MSDSPRRKSSPSPLVRALDEGAAPRQLAPVRSQRGSLAVAAAMILGAASALTTVGCSDERVKRDDGVRRERTVRDDRGEPRTNHADPVDQFVDAIGDLMNPADDEPKEVAKPVPPPPPPTSSITPDPTPPRPAGGISARRPPPPSTAKPKTVGFGS